MYCEGRMKPLFRGAFHFFGLLVITPFWLCVLISYLESHVHFLTFGILFFGNFFCWFTSSMFHVYPWKITEEIRWQKLGRYIFLVCFSFSNLIDFLDHSAIFVNIFCSYTPFAMLVLSNTSHVINEIILISTIGLLFICMIIGIYQVHVLKGSRMFSQLVMIAFSFPSYLLLSNYLTIVERACAMAGLFSYIIGTIIFAKRYCNFWPNIFGYHEIFHLFTLIAGYLGYYLLYSMLLDMEDRCQLNEKVMLNNDNNNYYHHHNSSLNLIINGFIQLLTSTISSPKDICTS
jgi:channel protein (hemolysin III family)